MGEGGFSLTRGTSMPVDEPSLVKTLLEEQPRLMAYIRSIVVSRETAEDVFQEVSLAACASRHEVSTLSALPAWLRSVARNKSVAVIRRQRASRVLFLDNATLDLLETHWVNVEAASGFGGAADRLEWCIQKLPPKGRELVELKYAEGLTGDEISARMKRSVASIYMALSRVRAALARCIREQGVSHEL